MRGHVYKRGYVFQIRDQVCILRGAETWQSCACNGIVVFKAGCVSSGFRIDKTMFWKVSLLAVATVEVVSLKRPYLLHTVHATDSNQLVSLLSQFVP